MLGCRIIKTSHLRHLTWCRICRYSGGGGAINGTTDHGQLLGQEAVDVVGYQALTTDNNDADDGLEAAEK